MKFESKYKILLNNLFENGDFSLIPIRFEDRLDIMKWRNEQIYHLRQSKPLTIEDQDNYFSNYVATIFNEDAPRNILFSFLRKGKLIGYGGLVHINWIDKNAEISFIMNTELEKNSFVEIWKEYLILIEKVAFIELKLHKLFTYAFDLRPHLYPVFEEAGFKLEARLKEHCYFNEEFKDVVIHSKINQNGY
jgi:RimJ/RimL family protein N-acetyltransferase